MPSDVEQAERFVFDAKYDHNFSAGQYRLIPYVASLGGKLMSPELTAVVEPFVRRGLFPNAETAVAEIARDYVLRQIERYRAVEAAFQAR